MSYVDAVLDSKADKIYVVERTPEGTRAYRELPTNYVFYYEDPKGKHQSIYGDRVSRFSTRKKAEFEKEARIKAESELFNHNNPKNLITLIAAASENNVIGKDNKLIWHLSDDLKHFKDLTKGHVVIMGRKTFESMPKALPNRTNIVITRKTDYIANDAIVVHSLNQALEKTVDDNQPFIIGGGEIYNIAIKIADRIELTRVHTEIDGDAYFPEINDNIWKEVSREKRLKDEKHNYDFTFIRYDKK